MPKPVTITIPADTARWLLGKAREGEVIESWASRGQAHSSGLHWSRLRRELDNAQLS